MAVPFGALTSENNKIRVSWIDTSSVPGDAAWTGRLGMTFLPGKHDRGVAGHHWRDLDLDIARLRNEHNVDVFLLLVEDQELAAIATTAIADVMSRHRIELIRFPVVDGGVPADLDAYRVMLGAMTDRLSAGQNVVVACRGGLGRTGTAVACLLHGAGLNAVEAVRLTREKRPGAIENAGQCDFVHGRS